MLGEGRIWEEEGVVVWVLLVKTERNSEVLVVHLHLLVLFLVLEGGRGMKEKKREIFIIHRTLLNLDLIGMDKEECWDMDILLIVMDLTDPMINCMIIWW